VRKGGHAATMPGRCTRLAALLLLAVRCAPGGTRGPEWAARLVRDVRAASFPELAGADVRVREFASDSDYFQARFSISRFILGRRMRYFIRVNSGAAISAAPEEARRAIVAHELAHLAYYARGNRLHVFGLLRLSGKGFRERFEKRADLEALRRGYAQGLKLYRVWLYEHVPPGALPEKKRDYFSPEEIDAWTRQMGK
jgi:hypothetical protein